MSTVIVSPLRRFKFSDLSRASKSVSAAADAGPVVIDRRDGDELVLMRRAQADADRLTLAQVTPLLVAFAEESNLSLAERVWGLYPWARFLTEQGRVSFVEEVVDVARACAAAGRFEPLSATLHAWQATAEAKAAGWDRVVPEWLDEPIRVERPA
jgi:hypothetical protein